MVSVPPGCEPEVLPEALGEVALVREADLEGHLSYGSAPGEKGFRPLEAEIGLIEVRADADLAAEHLEQVVLVPST